eukprot:10973-Eustigmatos_ZCMA.PRE.1
MGSGGEMRTIGSVPTGLGPTHGNSHELRLRGPLAHHTTAMSNMSKLRSLKALNRDQRPVVWRRR